MASFRYKGRDLEGRLINGEAQGDNAETIAAQLMASGITPVKIDRTVEAAGRWRDWSLPGFESKPQLADLMLFCRQMYALMKAGIPIMRALRGLAESTRHPRLAVVLHEVVDTLNTGRDLTGCLARYPDVFSPLFVSVVKVGENSGRLDDAFNRLYHYISFELYTREKVKTALRYPAIVLTAVAVAVGVLVNFVVPQFARIFAAFKADLPLPTKLIIAVSNFSVAYWPYVLTAVVVAVFAVRAYLGTQRGRYIWDRAKLKLPVVGSIVLRATLARFARGFAMVVKSGVPLLDGLALISRAVENEYVGSLVRTVRDNVERGDSVSRAAASTRLFTPLVLQMLAVGEETGKLDEMMEEVAEFYDREVRADVDNLGALIEPLLLVVVGGVVLVLALGVFLPMWDLAGAAMGRR